MTPSDKLVKLQKVLKRASNTMNMFSVCVGSTYSLLKRPSSVNPIKHHRRIQSSDSCPLSHWHNLSLKLYHSGISLIKVLFRKCCPPTIFLRVVSIGVNSVNGCVSLTKNLYMFFVGRIHIVDKLIKRFPLTPYSTSTVSRKSNTLTIVTSLHNSVPLTIKNTSTESVSVPSCFFHTIIYQKGLHAWKNVTPLSSKLIMS